MQRFLMLVGIAVVAAAMYVAAAPGSQQAKKPKAPTAREFNALKKQVATLSKNLKKAKTEADAAVGVIGSCYLTVSGNTATFTVLPVSQFGTATDGFDFGPPGVIATTARTALDIAATGTTPQAYLQEVSPTCVASGALTHGTTRSGIARLKLWAERTR
jgi:hypothetical protein